MFTRLWPRRPQAKASENERHNVEIASETLTERVMNDCEREFDFLIFRSVCIVLL